ncbi:histidinol dehydrogenase [Anaerovirgula multivorans]|uniref:Histidinol dehydrogenase n=1 Tax=Anaerovirgula multivorans TaxID=312168 RepID=A0A239G247_9FIRM|nr:histidinol dehydrogenase [Anaerovirgula multivorans]SNS63045.1 histidinol dehydrogenase [Anaerovirgula multivorans]
MMKTMDLKGPEKDRLLKELKERGTVDFKDYQDAVQTILDKVSVTGDQALLEYTKQFDGIDLSAKGLKVTEEEVDEAYSLVSEEFLRAIRLAIDNITDYHEKQRQNSWFTSSEGTMLGQKITPIASVGIYVPGGTAAYPSSVLMNAIPAKVAGVERIVMVTPPNKEGKLAAGVLVAAKELGIEEIYKVGGAQAIGALAYGTNTIAKVNKIVGPGNIYVATAKREVYGYVDIDMIAGPSEILVIADASANPKYVAADLLSQAEHDELSSAIFITTSEDLGKAVAVEVAKQTAKLERKSIVEKSLINYGKIILVKDLEEAIDLSNEIAPEHLELCVEKPFELLDQVKNAGAIFLGHYAPEPLGDYLAGPNHVLPTSGTAKFYSPLSVEDFIKKSSVIYYNQKALEKVKNEVMTLAETEGLTAHKNSIKVRFE